MKKDKLIATILLVSSLILVIFMVMYLNETPLVVNIGGDLVNGVQRRYFSTIFLFIIILFINNISDKYFRSEQIKAGRVIMETMCIMNPIIIILIILL